VIAEDDKSDAGSTSYQTFSSPRLFGMGITVVALHESQELSADRKDVEMASATPEVSDLIGMSEQEYAAALTVIAQKEAAVFAERTAHQAQRARATRAAAALRAAEIAAAEVDRTAAAVRLKVAATALRIARSAADAATLATASVVPGGEAAAARDAARLAMAVTNAAMATAEEAALAAKLVARAAAAAAVQVAAVAADTEKMIEGTPAPQSAHVEP
jgi:hypothetical protein